MQPIQRRNFITKLAGFLGLGWLATKSGEATAATIPAKPIRLRWLRRDISDSAFSSDWVDDLVKELEILPPATCRKEGGCWIVDLRPTTEARRTEKANS